MPRLLAGRLMPINIGSLGWHCGTMTNEKLSMTADTSDFLESVVWGEGKVPEAGHIHRARFQAGQNTLRHRLLHETARLIYGQADIECSSSLKLMSEPFPNRAGRKVLI
jgi:hypothetical protein